MITKKLFGICPSGAVDAYTLTNQNAMSVTVLTYGATIQKILVPTVKGPIDVCLGYDTLEEYMTNKGYYGATIGRYANRIAGAGFSLDGKFYSLTPNQGTNQLHGGPDGFDRKLWNAQVEKDILSLSYCSPAGENGFPGQVQVTVRYSLRNDNTLQMEYFALPDAPTPINMTNHTYFNLHGGGSVLEDVLWIDADRYTATDKNHVPTGELPLVTDTPYDFLSSKALGKEGVGYDTNFCINGHGLRLAAHLTTSDVSMEMHTTQPGVQLYCAPIVNPKKGKNGCMYVGSCFVCLEAQNYPDAVNHPSFPSSIFTPNKPYHQIIQYRFS